MNQLAALDAIANRTNRFLDYYNVATKAAESNHGQGAGSRTKGKRCLLERKHGLAARFRAVKQKIRPGLFPPYRLAGSSDANGFRQISVTGRGIRDRGAHGVRHAGCTGALGIGPKLTELRQLQRDIAPAKRSGANGDVANLRRRVEPVWIRSARRIARRSHELQRCHAQDTARAGGARKQRGGPAVRGGARR